MPAIPYSEEDRAGFARFAELYILCRAALRDISVETQSRAAPGSQAALDQQALLDRDPPIAASSEHLITWLVQLYVYAASEHLGGLGALYAVEEVLLSPIVLARCAIEHCAHAVWILGKQGDDAENRLARAFLEEINGAEEAKKQAGRLFDKTGGEHRTRTRIYRDVWRDAEATFAPPHRNDNGGPLLRGQSLPSPEDIVLQMNRAVTRPLTDREMSGAYGFLSNYVHPTPYSLRELFTVNEENGKRVAELARDLSFHERLAKLVVVPFYNALTYIMSYHGWASARHRQLSDDIDRLLPDVFVGSPSPGPFDHPA